MWYVYIVECSDNSYYCGVTTDLDRRLLEHNTSKRGAKYTRSRRPVKLLWSCEKQNRSEAQKEEYRIKKLTKDQKYVLINWHIF